MSTPPNVAGGTGRRLAVTLVFALVASAVALVGGGGAAIADDGNAPAEVTAFAAGEPEPFHKVRQGRSHARAGARHVRAAGLSGQPRSLGHHL